MKKNWWNNFLMEGEPGAAGGGAGPGEGGAPPPASKVEWSQVYSSLPDDLKNDPSLKTITSVEGLAKSFIHGQKAIGKDKIVVPDKHATPDDYKAIFHKLGVPEKIEDYKMNLGEGVDTDTEVLKAVTQMAHAQGILPWQMENVVKGFNELAAKQQKAQEEAYEAHQTEQINALKKEWGQAFDDQSKRANVAMKHLLPNAEDQQALIDAGLGSNPALLKAFANAAKLLKEDVFVGQGEGKLAGLTPQAALEKAKTIQGDPNHPYRNMAHPNHRAAKEEVANLYKIAFPE